MTGPWLAATALVSIACGKAAGGGIGDFVQTLITLLVGFVLTTVVGTFLAAKVQQRTWANQWATQRNSEDLAQAQKVFEEVSRMLDRRLFWVRQFRHWSQQNDAERLRNALKGYRAVIQDWNESINRNLAMLQTYFGQDVRTTLDSALGALFVEVGAKAEQLYRGRPVIDPQLAAELDVGVEQLRLAVYAYNVAMLDRIDERYRRGRPG